MPTRKFQNLLLIKFLCFSFILQNEKEESKSFLNKLYPFGKAATILLRKKQYHHSFVVKGVFE
jgi:hypothetical protein